MQLPFAYTFLLMTLPTAPVLQYRNYLCTIHPDSPARSPHLPTQSAEHTKNNLPFRAACLSGARWYFLPLIRGEVLLERFPGAFLPLAVEVKHKHTPLSVHFVFLLQKATPTRCRLQNYLLLDWGNCLSLFDLDIVSNCTLQIISIFFISFPNVKCLFLEILSAFPLQTLI